MSGGSIPLPGGAVPIDVALTLTVWVEIFVYGFYTWLFVSALFVLLKRTSDDRSPGTAWIFLTSIIVMYIIATLHLAVMLYRFMRAYIILVDPRGGLYYYYNPLRWDNVLNSVLPCVMSWIGDSLVIFRCYHVWNCNFWIILLPLMLLIATIGANSYVLFWFTHPYDTSLDLHVLFSILKSVYPVAFVQNLLTTGLISLRIWYQHRASSAAGVVDRGSRLSLIRVLRIVIESAMIYTLQIFLIIILFYRNDSMQFVVQAAIVPSIGIVFVLIAVRVHVAQKGTTLGTGIDTIPVLFSEGSVSVELRALESSSTSPYASVASRLPNNLDGDHNEDSEPFRSSYVQKGLIGDKLL